MDRVSQLQDRIELMTFQMKQSITMIQSTSTLTKLDDMNLVVPPGYQGIDPTAMYHDFSQRIMTLMIEILTIIDSLPTIDATVKDQLDAIEKLDKEHQRLKGEYKLTLQRGEKRLDQVRGAVRHIVANNVTTSALARNWDDETNTEKGKATTASSDPDATLTAKMEIDS